MKRKSVILCAVMFFLLSLGFIYCAFNYEQVSSENAMDNAAGILFFPVFLLSFSIFNILAVVVLLFTSKNNANENYITYLLLCFNEAPILNVFRLFGYLIAFGYLIISAWSIMAAYPNIFLLLFGICSIIKILAYICLACASVDRKK